MLLFCVMCVSFTSWAQQDTMRYRFCPSSPVVRDHEGNIYRTVQIKEQCWMAENMRCITSPKGHKWYRNPYFTASQPEFAAFYATPVEIRFGILYNWTAAMDLPAHQNNDKPVTTLVRGICPEGWHLPNNEDWSLLFAALGGNRVAGEMMKAPSQQWDPYFSIMRENSGFDALPAGSFTEEGLRYAGMRASFWCADNFNNIQAWCCTLYDFKNDGYNYLDYKCYGHSVRCVKNRE